MSFPLVPTAAGQVIPGIRFTGERASTSNFLGLDPCSLLPEGGTLWNICKGLGDGPGPIPPGIIPPPPPTTNQCGPGFTWSVLLQRCIQSGGVPGDPGFDTPAETSLGESIHGPNGHADTIPKQREIRRRVCPKGAVLGKRGWCHDKIANKDRLYPKPRKALGTPGELNALTTSKRFAKRLLAAEKTIKVTARDLAKAGGIKLGGR